MLHVRSPVSNVCYLAAGVYALTSGRKSFRWKFMTTSFGRHRLNLTLAAPLHAEAMRFANKRGYGASELIGLLLVPYVAQERALAAAGKTEMPSCLLGGATMSPSPKRKRSAKVKVADEPLDEAAFIEELKKLGL
jgi:hypothetical protein